ncbi:Rsrc1 [Phodopus roborovskii]|uniref:Rsrc1 protein n=1 Tax=Phodopus roborovskii TaxID=109678 RepID=A0AAU9ZU94_PHORO|nr:Rsrc1 [Phodopus roborovskii]
MHSCKHARSNSFKSYFVNLKLMQKFFNGIEYVRQLEKKIQETQQLIHGRHHPEVRNKGFLLRIYDISPEGQELYQISLQHLNPLELVLWVFVSCQVERTEHEYNEQASTLVEQVKRVKEIEAIESDSFIQQTFRSSKEVKTSVEPCEVKHATPASGPTSVAADPPSTGKEIDPDSIPTAIKYQDDNSLAHPNLFIEKAEAEEKWFKRLIALRQERLMGSPVA